MSVPGRGRTDGRCPSEAPCSYDRRLGLAAGKHQERRRGRPRPRGRNRRIGGVRRTGLRRMLLGESDRQPRGQSRATRARASSPTRSRDARPRKSESDRADRCSRTLEIGRRQKSRVDDARECICHATADHVRVTGQIGIDRTERSDQRSAWPCGETPMKASRPARNFSFSSHATRRSQCPPPRSSHITAAT
jgi:hypothetical protein